MHVYSGQDRKKVMGEGDSKGVMSGNHAKVWRSHTGMSGAMSPAAATDPGTEELALNNPPPLGC